MASEGTFDVDDFIRDHHFDYGEDDNFVVWSPWQIQPACHEHDS